MTFSPAALASLLPECNADQRFLIALSGGLDSVVLLHALASLKLPVPLVALHVNHQISPNAHDWHTHCASLCSALQVPLIIENVQVDRAGRGLEDAARAARYSVFEKYIQADDFLLTAHHADDQVETFFLRLLRGAGPRGLAAMAEKRTLGAGHLCRPLLAFNRSELQAYADNHRLSWVEDESNFDTAYDRNFLRQRLIPQLQERWPQLQRRVRQTAALCADSEILLQDLAELDLRQCDCRLERLGQSLHLSALAKLSVARRHNALRIWLRGQRLDVPEQVHLQQFEQQFMAAREDAEVALAFGNLTLHRYRERLYAVPQTDAKEPEQIHFIQPLKLPAHTVQIDVPNGLLRFEYCERVVDVGWMQADLTNLTVRLRQGGERCRPAGRAHSQTLKRLLQEYALAPWLRNSLPLVYSGDELVAAGDLWVCHEFIASPGQSGYRLVWHVQHIY